jgi:hypothetical protein
MLKSNVSIISSGLKSCLWQASKTPAAASASAEDLRQPGTFVFFVLETAWRIVDLVDDRTYLFQT